MAIIRASSLHGRTVVDMDAAEKIGQIEEILLDMDSLRVAGFVVSHGLTFVETGAPKVVLPAASIHAVGPDAVTVHRAGTEAAAPAATSLTLSRLAGRKMVSQSGTLLGTVLDALIDSDNGRLAAYVLGAENPLGKLGAIFGGGKVEHHDYVRGDAALRIGPEVIVVPDEAFLPGEGSGDSLPAALAFPSLLAGEAAPQGWGERDSPPPFPLRAPSPLPRPSGAAVYEQSPRAEDAALTEDATLIMPCPENKPLP